MILLIHWTEKSAASVIESKRQNIDLFL